MMPSRSTTSSATRQYLAFSLAALLVALVLATIAAVRDPKTEEVVEEVVFTLGTHTIGIMVVINAVAALALAAFISVTSWFLGNLDDDELVVCRKRVVSFASFKLVMAGFVFHLALDVNSEIMAVWLCSLILVVALSAVARRRRERLSAHRFSWATHGACVLFTLVTLAIDAAVLLLWLWVLVEEDWSLTLLLAVDCLLEAVSLWHVLARIAIEAYDAHVLANNALERRAAARRLAQSSGSTAAAAASQTGPEAAITEAELDAVEDWEGKVSATMVVDFINDAGGMVLTLLHYLHVWWTAGLNFSLMDVLLALNCRAVFIQLQKRATQHMEYFRRTSSLQTALRELEAPTERQLRDSEAVCGIMQVSLATHPDDDEASLSPKPSATASSSAGAAAESRPLGESAGVSSTASLRELLDRPRQDVAKTACGHFFIRKQLRRWLQMPESNGQCPVCRTSIVSTAPPVQGAQPGGPGATAAPVPPQGAPNAFAADAAVPPATGNGARAAEAAPGADTAPAAAAATGAGDGGGIDRDMPDIAVPPPGVAFGAGSPFMFNAQAAGLDIGIGFGPLGIAQAMTHMLNGFQAGRVQPQAAAAAAAGAGAGLGAQAAAVRQEVMQVLEVAPGLSPAAIEILVRRGMPAQAVLELHFSQNGAVRQAAPGEVDAYVGAPPPPPPQAQQAQAHRSQPTAAASSASSSATAPTTKPKLPEHPGEEPKLPAGARGAEAAMKLMRARSDWLVALAKHRHAAAAAAPAPAPRRASSRQPFGPSSGSPAWSAMPLTPASAPAVATVLPATRESQTAAVSPPAIARPATRQQARLSAAVAQEEPSATIDEPAQEEEEPVAEAMSMAEIRQRRLAALSRH